MFSLSLAVQHVELVSDKSWFAEYQGSLVIAFAAFVAGAVTIFDRRRALDNDRHMKRLEHMRDRIDNALAAATRGQEAVGNFLSHVTRFEDFRIEQRRIVKADPSQANKDALAKLEKEINEHLASQRDATIPIVQNLAVEDVYLYVRFRTGHPIYDQYNECTRLNLDLYSDLQTGVDDNRDPQSRAKDKVRNEARREAHREFRETCRQWFVKELPRGDWSSSENAPVTGERR